MQLYLMRDDVTADGVFGVLRGPTFAFQTMEDDWRNNAPGKSCIPAGVYPLRRSWYHKHGYEAFEVCDVPGRSPILIHIANTEEDVEGCIGLGLRRGRLWVARDEETGQTHVLKRAVVSSREAFGQFMAAMAHVDEAMLTVDWAAAVNPERKGAA